MQIHSMQKMRKSNEKKLNISNEPIYTLRVPNSAYDFAFLPSILSTYGCDVRLLCVTVIIIFDEL